MKPRTFTKRLGWTFGVCTGLWVGLESGVGLPAAAAQQFGETRTPAGSPPGTPVPATVPTEPAAPRATPPASLPSFPGSPMPRGTSPSPRIDTTPPAKPTFTPEPPHEWAVQPSHGEWMICVKSYAGAKAKGQAVELCDQIRKNYRAAAYLYDRNYDERMREAQRQAEFRAARERELEPFLKVQAEMKQAAQKEGREFLEMPVKIHTPVVRIEEQWAVLVGGFKDMDTAAAALKQIRAWPAPQGQHLMDQVVMQRPGTNGQAATAEATYLNPFTNALVVPNPSIKRTQTGTLSIDPALVRLNEEEPFSLLRNPKGWTLIVKDFSVPLTVQTKDQEGSIIGRIFGPNNDPAAMLEATAKQARELAKALRDPKMNDAANRAATRLGLAPRPLESYVLHVRTGSRVTVGGFDGPDDPALGEMQRLLANMSFLVQKTENGRTTTEEVRLFDGITPMPVPRLR